MRIPSGVPPFVPHPDLVKEKRLSRIRSHLGRMAWILLRGRQATSFRIAQGIRHAWGALKWVAEIVEKERDKKK